MKKGDILVMNVIMLQLELEISRNIKSCKQKGVRYSCDQCEYAAPSTSSLKKHIGNIHEGYLCGDCDYVATLAKYLKRHIRHKHVGVRYPCDQCEYVATSISHLNSEYTY